MYDGQWYDAHGYGTYHAHPDGSVWLPWISDEDHSTHETRVAYDERLAELLPWPLGDPTGERPARRIGTAIADLRWAVATDLPPDSSSPNG
jgi:hypothetical protein